MKTKEKELREEFYKDEIKNRFTLNEVVDWWIEKFNSHNEELIKKIEKLKKIKPYETTQESLYQPYQFVDCDYNQALDEVIKIINFK